MILFLILWAFCGVLACGITFHHFQTNLEWKWIRRSCFNSDKVIAKIMLLGGPIGMVVALIMSHDVGFLWPWSERARQEAGL